MSVQIALLAPATRVASRKLGPTAGRRSGGSPSTRSRCLCDEQVRRARGAGARRPPSAGRGRRGRSPSAALPGGAAAHTGARKDPGRARRRAQVPGGAVEQLRARVLDARRLGAGERMSADEARVGQRVARPGAWSSPRRSPRSPAEPARAQGAPSRRARRPAWPRTRRPRPRRPRLRRRPARRSRRAGARDRRRSRRGHRRATCAPHARARRARSSRRSDRRRGLRPSTPASPGPCRRARWGGRSRAAGSRWPAPKSDRAERLARERRRLLHRAGVLREVVCAQQLGTVADGLVGVGMHLDDYAVRADRGGRQRQGPD